MIFKRCPLVTYLTIAFVLGIIFAFKLSVPQAFLMISIIVSALFFIVKKPPLVLAIAIFLLLGLFLGSFQKSIESNNPFKRYYEKNVVVEGLIVSDIVKKTRLYAFDLRVNRLNNRKVNTLVRVYAEKGDVASGYIVRLQGLVKPSLLKSASAPQSTIFSQERITNIGSSTFWLRLGNLRRWVKKSLLEKKGQARAFLYAILTGQTSELSEQSKANLRASGLAHLWAVSGLHTGFVLLLILFLLRLLRFRAGWQLVILMVSLYLFAAFTGFKPPVVRASIMAAWMSAAYLLGRRKSWLAALSSAALFSLLINPATLFDPSFQLSFAAVTSLFAFNGKIAALIEGIPLKLKSLLSASISVQILTLPLLAYYFGEIPVFAVLANLVVIPLTAIAFYLTILGLIAKATGIKILLALPTLLSAFILKIAAFFNSFSLSTLVLTPVFVVVLLISLAFLAFLFKKNRRSIKFSYLFLSVLLLIAVELWWPAADSVIAGRKLTVEFLDVGQGDASLITGPERQTILIDGGPKPYKIQQDLIKRKVKLLDLVVPSHADADHMAGLPTVLRNFKVRAVLDNGYPKASFLYREFKSIIRAKKIRYILARRNDEITIGSLKLQILNPPEGFIRGSNSDDNENSIVLRINYSGTSFLFTGDLGFEGERNLIKLGPIQSTVLKVGHHGSAYSTSSQFLKEVQPGVAVISAGAGNNYGHPAPILLRRLGYSHAKIYRTDLSSDIRMVANKAGLQVYD